MKKFYALFALYCLVASSPTLQAAHKKKVIKKRPTSSIPARSETPPPPPTEEETPPPPPPLEREISRSETPPPPTTSEELAPPPPAPEEEEGLKESILPRSEREIYRTETPPPLPPTESEELAPPPPAAEEEATKEAEQEKTSAGDPATEWFNAASRGLLQTMKKLYQTHPTFLNAKHIVNRWPALMIAADIDAGTMKQLTPAGLAELRKNKEAAIEWLVSLRDNVGIQIVDPGYYDKEEWTPLSLAVKSGLSVPTLKSLIQLGVPVSTPNPEGQTALDIAKANKNNAAINLLMQEIEKATWFNAAAQGDLETMQKLYAGNKSLLEARDPYQNTALLKTLNISDADRTAFHQHQQQLFITRKQEQIDPKNREAVFNWLLEQGADATAVDETGLNALMVAAESGFYKRVLQKILDKGVSVTAKTVRGRTALMSAAEGNSEHGVYFLLQNGATPTINDQTAAGMTALMFAAQRGGTETVRDLLRAGANPELKNTSKNTAADLAYLTGGPTEQIIKDFVAANISGGAASPAQEKTTAAETKKASSTAISIDEPVEQAYKKYSQFVDQHKNIFGKGWLVNATIIADVQKLFPGLNDDTIRTILGFDSDTTYLFLQGYVIGNDDGYDYSFLSSHALTTDEINRLNNVYKLLNKTNSQVSTPINSWLLRFNNQQEVYSKVILGEQAKPATAATKEAASIVAISPQDNADTAWNSYKDFIKKNEVFSESYPFKPDWNAVNKLSEIFPNLDRLNTIKNILESGWTAKYVLFLQGYAIGNNAGYDPKEKEKKEKHHITPEEEKRARAAIKAMTPDSSDIEMTIIVPVWTQRFDTRNVYIF